MSRIYRLYPVPIFPSVTHFSSKIELTLAPSLTQQLQDQNPPHLFLPKQCMALSKAMLNPLQKVILRMSYCAALVGWMAAISPLSFAQTKGDIVRIGGSVKDQNYYQSYWQNLRAKDVMGPRNSPSPPAPPTQPTSVLLSAQSLKNLRVHDLRLIRSDGPNYRFRQNITTPFFPGVYGGQPDIFVQEDYRHSRHFGHERFHSPNNSMGLIAGTLTNLNTFPVKVLSVNFKIVDAFGELIQTGTVSPEPTLISPRQSVTFQKPLYALPLHNRYEVRLLNPAFVLGD
jgi:hypothetical protein